MSNSVITTGGTNLSGPSPSLFPPPPSLGPPLPSAAEAATSVTADYTLSPAQLHAVLVSLTEIGQPVMCWGPPGVGKSAVARQVAAATNREYVDVRALLLDPVDLRGIPWRDDQDRTRWAPPVFLPSEERRWLICLEELPAAPPMVQAALYQLVLDRKIGEYELPAGAALIACGNRESDRGVSNRMPTPLASRFVHLELKPTLDDWCDWALKSNLAPQVIAFLQFRPELLMDFDPVRKGLAFPCPRTWEFVSRVIEKVGTSGNNADLLRPILRGAVGEGAAVEFAAFLSVWAELPHPREILADPESAPIPDNQSALLALCGSLYRHADEVTLPAIVVYARRLRPEVGEFLVTSCVRRNGQLRTTRAWIEWVSVRSA